MPEYEVCIAASHCLTIAAGSREAAEEIGLEQAKAMRGFAFDEIEVSSVQPIAPIDDPEEFKAAAAMGEV